MHKQKLLLEVLSLVEARSSLHIDDPAVNDYWNRLCALLSTNLEDTMYILDNAGEPNLFWLSEVFDDVAAKFQSEVFIRHLKNLEKTYPAAVSHGDILLAQEAMASTKPNQ